MNNFHNYPCRLSAVLLLVALFSVALLAQTKVPAESLTDTTVWKLVWSDEFNAPQLDTNTWRLSDGGGGWGNGELQKYTNLPENIRLEQGNLVIEARKTDSGYTSARMNTRFGERFTYGRVESRMKIPQTQAIWPALWMMGDTNEKAWPGCGEIDIMEAIGKEPRVVHGTVHGPGYSGAKGIGKGYTTPALGDSKESIHDFGSEWHIVSLEWEPEAIRWYMDGVLFNTLSPNDIPAGKKWVFDHDFYLIVNLAVGGAWPDYPDASSVFPQQFVLDYLRVYQKK